jgi:hypothetical protein
VVQAHLDRIEAVNPHLNAIVRLLPDQTLAVADAADRAVADGNGRGPLHGVPFTVKENIDLAGTPTTHAIPALAEAVAPVDAPAGLRHRQHRRRDRNPGADAPRWYPPVTGSIGVSGIGVPRARPLEQGGR